MLSFDDTIAAIASAPGGAARGIVRISGPAALNIVCGWFPANDLATDLQCARSASIMTGNFVAGAVTLPVDLFIWPTARSFTRQPLVEIHTFGSPPLLEMALQTLCAAGARLAQPGEFTMRAFLAGRIDLMQAEAVLGVIDATDRLHLDTALSQLAGGLSRPMQALRDDLLNLLADLEAGLDFVEDDIRFIAREEIQRRLASAAEQLENVSTQFSVRHAGYKLPAVVLFGLPNVGKSSLFNALKGSSTAIVSPIPGTTRDYLRAPIDAAGLEIELIDTAGIERGMNAGSRNIDQQNADRAVPLQIEHAAERASVEQQRQANLRLLCIDSTRPITDWERDAASSENLLVVFTKCDRTGCVASSLPNATETSSQTGVGLDQLLLAIRTVIQSQVADGGAVASTAARIHESVRLAAQAIGNCQTLVANLSGEELIASEVRVALAELGKIVGAIYSDELLDRIFSRFCIGK